MIYDKYIDSIVNDAMMKELSHDFRDLFMNKTEHLLIGSIANDILYKMALGIESAEIDSKFSCIPSSKHVWVEFDINNSIHELYGLKCKNSEILEHSVGIYITSFNCEEFLHLLKANPMFNNDKLFNFISERKSLVKTLCFYNIFEVINGNIMALGKIVLLFDEKDILMEGIGTFIPPQIEISLYQDIKEVILIYSQIVLKVFNTIQGGLVDVIDIGKGLKSVENFNCLQDFVKVCLY